jgi:hypothetical protein
VQLDRQAGVADLGEELVEVGEGRLGPQRRTVVGLADDAE